VLELVSVNELSTLYLNTALNNFDLIFLINHIVQFHRQLKYKYADSAWLHFETIFKVSNFYSFVHNSFVSLESEKRSEIVNCKILAHKENQY